ncbi:MULTISPECIES: P-loop NTPase fold protein [Citrobacter]|uniref:KAP family P-loop NTPase fold protein n=1 Tax=Citrobacter sp. JUb117 TaxID=2940600 RepID=UPI0015E99EB0|nr:MULTISPECIES: P-loop NTPase fold protein [Citrobacter]MCS3464480.1 hypothetical protein [Citrobacter sp. JUb117]QMF22112.1 AAA family ATPase [Citrobacter freundii]
MKERHTVNDGPVTGTAEDRYGYDSIASNLAGRILALTKGSSQVFGIEGKWGSGKTSLLNLLMEHLNAQDQKNTHVLPVSPWLSAAGSPLIESLLLPVAAILDEHASSHYSRPRKLWQKLRKAPASPLAQSLLGYVQKASGRLAPLAEFGGNFVPGMGFVAEGMKTVSKLDLSAHKETTELLRRRIEAGIASYGLNFVVLIDDLDRLEPAQAVEVLRLVRSVADFSGFRYILCYDPEVLAHAIERELGVPDGRLYLQKIIPLSFTLPHHEIFDLQRELLRGAIALYEQVNQDLPTEAEQTDLRKVSWIYGQELSTPREVALVLSALEFRYSSIRDYVYFPDLCLLQLIRVTNPGLYDWAEQYLARYFVTVSGELTHAEPEQERLKQKLKACLEHYTSPESASVTELGRWLPGITEFADNLVLFNTGTSLREEPAPIHKRLNSPTNWRYYFAFSAPQNVLPPGVLDNLLFRFGIPAERLSLAIEMLENIREINLSHVTWYDHILSQLTPRKIAQLTFSQCEGLLRFFFQYGDIAVQRQQSLGRKDYGHASSLMEVCHLLGRILGLHRARGLWLLRTLFLQGEARNWLVRLMRDLLWGHGLRGTRSWEQEDQFLSDDELSALAEALAMRMRTAEMLDSVFAHPDLGEYLYAWRDIDSASEISRWIGTVQETNDGFIHLLNGLRGYAWSSVTGDYRSLNSENVSNLMGPIDAVVARLQELTTDPRLFAEADELLKTLKRSNRDIRI